MDDPAFEAAKRQAAEMAALFAGLQVVTEAELAIRGIWPVSVVHGDAETAEDADLIYGALHRLAGECGQLAGYRGGNDYTTFLFTRARRRDRRQGVPRPGTGNGAPPVVAHHRHGAPRLALSKGPRA